MAQREFWETGGIYRPSEHPVVEQFARQRIRYLAECGLLADVHSLLDVGAGSGFSSRYYPARVRVVACDYAAGMLRSNPVRDKVLCAAERLPFPDCTFDVVTCWELLHHLEAPADVLREMLRVARRRVLIFEPNRVNPGHIYLALTRDNERQSLRFSPRHVRRLVAEAGGLVRLQVRGGLLFPNITPLPVAWLLSRLPFRIPVVGISQLVVAERKVAAAGRPSPP